MRLTPQLLPLFLLLLLPVLQCLGHITSLLGITFFLICTFFLRTALLFLKLGKRQKDKRLILESISISHYVEKVRWCLDFLDLPYTEEENVGILGILTLGRTVPQLKVPQAALTIGNSSDILRYLHGREAHRPAREAFLRGTKEARKWEERFDLLGEHYRRFCYHSIFTCGDVAAYSQCVWGKFQGNIPTWQRSLLALLAPVFQLFVSTKLAVTKEEAERSLKEATNICREVDELLSDGREFLLATPGPTFLDFHFCSMVAIVLSVPEYSGGLLSPRTLAEMARYVTPAVVEEGERLRATRSGQFMVNCFQKLRRAKVEE